MASTRIRLFDAAHRQVTIHPVPLALGRILGAATDVVGGLGYRKDIHHLTEGVQGSVHWGVGEAHVGGLGQGLVEVFGESVGALDAVARNAYLLFQIHHTVYFKLTPVFSSQARFHAMRHRPSTSTVDPPMSGHRNRASRWKRIVQTRSDPKPKLERCRMR